MSEIDIETLGRGRFVLEKRLGSGSTGTVFAARDQHRDENVALKVLTYRSAAALYRFKREFRTLADVTHPNLVSFYDLFADEEDEVFFTMELVSGVDILEYTRDAEPNAGAPDFDEDRLRQAFRQLASGVAALHEKETIHCDLKPNNVLVDRSGRLVILDFGIARDLAPSITPQSLYQGLSGTIPYMSPEQAKGSSPCPASDWYAVGVILFEALTGRMPFEGSLVDVLSAKVSRAAPSPHRFSDALPGDLAELVTALLEPDPEKRLPGSEMLRRFGVEPPRSEAENRLDSRLPSGVDLAALGRKSVLAELHDAFRVAREGREAAVYIHGKSGLGKTALIQYFLKEVRRSSNAVVLAGRCYERELVPYKALDGIVDSLSRYLNRHGDKIALTEGIEALCRLFPVLERLETLATASRQTAEISDRPRLRRRATAALAEIFRRIAAERPLVLYIDDLHWADADSTALLQELLRPPGAPPILLLASFRSEEIAAKPFLRDLLYEAGTATVREVRLRPLDDPAAGELARALLGEAATVEPIVAAIVREAAGSPFLIEQLVSYAGATESSLSGSITFNEMLAARLHQLPDGAPELLLTLAAAGRPLEASVAYEAAGLTGDERSLITALRTAQLVRSSGSAGHVELFHNRIHEALEARLDEAETARIHARLAETLKRRGHDDPEALCEHLHRAGDLEQAGREAARAAARARAALAFDRAVLFLHCALEWSTLGEIERRALLEELAETLSYAGRTGESARVYLGLAETAEGMSALEFRRRAAEEFLSGGYFDEGLEVIRAVGREVGLELPESPKAAWTSFLLNRLRVRLRGLRFERRDPAAIPKEELLRADAGWIMAASLAQSWPIHGNAVQTRHLLLALETGDPVRISRALSLESTHRVANGASPQQTAHLRQTATELARSVSDTYAEGLSILHTGVAAYLSGRFKEGAEASERAESVLVDHRPGARWEVHQARRFSLNCRLYLGELTELNRRVPELVAEARERGNVLVVTDLAIRLNLIWLARDEPAEARRRVDEALIAWSRQGFHLPHSNALIARCQADLYEGEGEDALRRLLADWPRLRRSQLTRLALVDLETQYLRGRVALAAAAVAERARRLRIAGRSARRLARSKLRLGGAFSKLLSAGIAFLEADIPRSTLFLQGAERLFETFDLALYARVARRQRGEILGGEEGRKEVDTVDQQMREQGIVRPDRLTALFAPGFSVRR